MPLRYLRWNHLVVFRFQLHFYIAAPGEQHEFELHQNINPFGTNKQSSCRENRQLRRSSDEHVWTIQSYSTNNGQYVSFGDIIWWWNSNRNPFCSCHHSGAQCDQSRLVEIVSCDLCVRWRCVHWSIASHRTGCPSEEMCFRTRERCHSRDGQTSNWGHAKHKDNHCKHQIGFTLRVRQFFTFLFKFFFTICILFSEPSATCLPCDHFHLLRTLYGRTEPYGVKKKWIQFNSSKIHVIINASDSRNDQQLPQAMSRKSISKSNRRFHMDPLHLCGEMKFHVAK